MSRFSAKDADRSLQMSSGMETDGGNPATITLVLGAAAAMVGLNSKTYLRGLTAPRADIEGAATTSTNAKGYGIGQPQPRPAPATNAPPGGLDASAANVSAKKPDQYGVTKPRPDGPKPDIIYPPPGTIVRPPASITTGSRYQIQSQILDTSLESSRDIVHTGFFGSMGTTRFASPGARF
jgi:hypothetical protein